MTTYYNRNVKKADGTSATGTWTGLNQGTTAGSTVNNRGVIRRGGTIASPKWTSKPIAENTAVTGPIVYQNDTMDKALSAGVFAVMTAGEYIIRRVTTKLAGVAKTILRSSAADFATRRSIHKKESWRTHYLKQVTWANSGATLEDPDTNSAKYTFVYSDNAEAEDAFAFGQNSSATNPANQSTYDIAARPTLAQPGQLVYKTGRPAPVKALYSEKTG